MDIVGPALEVLARPLIIPIAICPGVREKVCWLRDELSQMQHFLKDAQERQYENALINDWVSGITELACDIENILFTFDLEAQRKQGCFSSIDCRLLNLGREMIRMYKMDKEIQNFKDRTNDLIARRQRYGLERNIYGEEGSNPFRRLRELGRSTPLAIEENVVGFEDEAHELLAKLLDEDPTHFVISIYGKEGSGKTTLARKLYHNDDVRRKFDCCGWVSVSQDYIMRDLLLNIIKSFMFETMKMEDLEEMSEVDLERYLREFFDGRSYIVVIDDVRSIEVWISLKRVFPYDNRSRVIITTRDKEVAGCSKEITHVHELRDLTLDESWQLFCMKAFQNSELTPELEKLGRKIVQKCNGLPLAVTTLSGLLSIKKPNEWQEVHDQLWQNADPIQINSLLAFNFNSLPYQLKPCFLYLSCFPNGIELSIEKLIHLLVAEGFIPRDGDGGCTMEEMAKDYLDILINRNLIQVGQKYWGKILTCRVHDVLHHLAIEKADKNFLVIYDDEVDHSTISSSPRQVIYSSTEDSSLLKKCNPRLRSLFLHGEYEFSIPMCKRFRSLRVLVDGSIGNDYVTRKLIHLKYLGLKNSLLFLSPSIVFNLPRLQTLHVPRFVFPVNLPAEISDSQELRHLIGNFTCVSSSIKELTKLQTLRSITSKAWTEIRTENLVDLRELWLVGPLIGQVFSFDSMSNLKRLRILSVELGHDNSLGSLQPLSGCEHLVELRLKGKMENLPGNIDEVLRKLECLSLQATLLKVDPMPLLEKLPNLMILHLGYRFYTGKNIRCGLMGFPRLEILLFDEHKFQIEQWQVGETALPRLKGLRLPEDFKLTIPERLRSLPTPDPQEYTTKLPDDAVAYALY